MPSIKFNKKSLYELLGRKLTDQELHDRISFLGCDVESMDDTEIGVEIGPNRPDLLSDQGLSRALKTFLNIKSGFRSYDVKKSSIKVIVDKSVKNIRPFTACAVVKNLRLTDEKIKEIIQIQEKLHVTYCRNRKKAAIGIYPLEHIKPPIFYKALRPEEIKFKPLDLNKDLSGSQILAIHPTGREYGHLLEGLEKYPVFIDSKQQFMSMPPVINSNSVGKITLQTRDVFIEASGFDFDYLHTCLNIVVAALADMGGQIESVEIVYPDKKYVTPNLAGTEMKIELDYVNKILGLELTDNDIKKLLERMGFEYKNKKALIPGYRADVMHPIDLVEDIAIAYGYEQFSGKIPKAATIARARPMEVFKNKLREVLIGLGLLEIKNYVLTNKDYQTKYMNYSGELVELANAITAEYNVVRTWLIPSSLETLRNNKQYEYPQNLFEIGSVFRINKDYDTGVQENERVCITLCGNDANFTKIRQVLEVFMEAFALKYSVAETEHASFIKGRVGRVLVNNEKIAYVGEIHPQVLLNWGIEMPVAMLELNLTDLFRVMNMNPDSPLGKWHDTKEETVRETKTAVRETKTASTAKTHKPVKHSKPSPKKKQPKAKPVKHAVKKKSSAKKKSKPKPKKGKKKKR